MEYKEQFYSPYKDLCEKGYQVIQTKDLNQGNIDNHFYSIINILKDGIETDEVRHMMVHVEFQNDTDLDFTIFDYVINLMFWDYVQQLIILFGIFILYFLKILLKDLLKNILIIYL